MDIIRNDTHIDFMARRKIALIFSAVLILASIGSLVTRGLDFGLDFTGGTLIEISYPEAPDLANVRGALDEAGYENFSVQTFGTSRDIVVRLPPEVAAEEGADVSTAALEALESVDPGVEIRRVEFVGPQIGEELANQGGLALLYALAGILLYVSFRFQWRFAVGAVAALVHDVLIVVGLISLFRISFDLTVVAALLAVIGYSLNDTIVVYDRLRENFRVKQGHCQRIDQPVDQPDAVAYRDDLADHADGPDSAVLLRRRNHPCVCLHPDRRRDRRYLFVDLRR